MSVEDQVFSEKDFGHLSCVDKKIWAINAKTVKEMRKTWQKVTSKQEMWPQTPAAPDGSSSANCADRSYCLHSTLL